MSSAARVILEARTAAGLSQAELARAARTSEATIARYESGDVDPRVETLKRLVLACGRRLELDSRPRFPGPVGRRLESRRDEVLAACGRHGATGPRVFGSVARGEDGPRSNLDLLVELGEGRTVLDLERLQLELREMLGLRVDVGTPGMLRDGLSAQVQVDLVSL